MVNGFSILPIRHCTVLLYYLQGNCKFKIISTYSNSLWTCIKMKHLLISVTLFALTNSVQSYEIEPVQNCNETIDANVKNLTFPGGEIGQLTNITWGIKEFGNKLNCVSRYLAHFYIFLFFLNDQNGIFFNDIGNKICFIVQWRGRFWSYLSIIQHK